MSVTHRRYQRITYTGRISRVRSIWVVLLQLTLNLLFKSLHGVLLSLAIYQRQEDAKDPQQTVGLVFLDRCFAPCDPPHPLINGELLEIAFP